MNIEGSGGSELSDSDYYGSELSAPSTLADLLSRFTIDWQPECTLKLRTKAGPVVVGADLTRITAVGGSVGALVLKPSNAGQAWRRLRVDNTGALTLRSRKLHWWLFTLDVIGHANPLSRTFDLSYRVATKWDVTRGEYRNKKRYELTPKTEARAHWSISYSLPAIEGSMGTAAQRVSREVHADVGYAHLSIPRLELVVWPRGRPEQPADGRAAGGGEDVAECGSGTARAQGCCADVEAAGSPAGGGGALAPLAPAAPSAAPGGRSADGTGGAEGGGEQGADGRGSGGRLRAALNLKQLNSHTACLSGRWWETFGQR